eukprot:1194311-Prorocentrum_minimum.AAC.5
MKTHGRLLGCYPPAGTEGCQAACPLARSSSLPGAAAGTAGCFPRIAGCFPRIAGCAGTQSSLLAAVCCAGSTLQGRGRH